jgi:hypothetical protein
MELLVNHLPKAVKPQWYAMQAVGLFKQTNRPLTVAGAALVRKSASLACTLQLPVELRRVNHTASTNSVNFTRKDWLITDNSASTLAQS